MRQRHLAAIVALIWVVCPAARCYGRTVIGDICRVKGQEANTLHGLGLVVGLKGTGDGADFAPTVRSLAKSMELLGRPVGAGPNAVNVGPSAVFKGSKNVALVYVTATIPGTGARQGDQIDCVLSAYAAKSLVGGRLMYTAMIGPENLQNPVVYGFAHGPVELEDPDIGTTGRIHGGLRLESDRFMNPYSLGDKVTLVVNKQHASFQTAQTVAHLINASPVGFQAGSSTLAKALDAVSIEVTIPRQYLDNKVAFVSQLLDVPIDEMEASSKVVVNERRGTIIIGSEVEIKPVAISHKNMVVIETGTSIGENHFVPVDPAQLAAPKLKSLVDALNAVQVPTEDVIQIIKELDRGGNLNGQLIVE